MAAGLVINRRCRRRGLTVSLLIYNVWLSCAGTAAVSGSPAAPGDANVATASLFQSTPTTAAAALPRSAVACTASAAAPIADAAADLTAIAPTPADAGGGIRRKRAEPSAPCGRALSADEAVVGETHSQQAAAADGRSSDIGAAFSRSNSSSVGDGAGRGSSSEVGASPTGRHSATLPVGGNASAVAAGGSPGGGDVIIHYPGEHDTDHGSSGGKAQSGDSGKDEKPPAQPGNATLPTTATTSATNRTSTTAHALELSSNSDNPRTTESPTTDLMPPDTTVVSAKPAGNVTSSLPFSRMSSSDNWLSISTELAVNVTTTTTTVNPKPSKPPHEDVTDPKLPPKPSAASPNTTATTAEVGAATGGEVAIGTTTSGGASSVITTTSRSNATSLHPAALSTVSLSSASAGLVSLTGTIAEQPSTRVPARNPPVLITVRLRMSREQFCCAADDFRSTIVQVMERVNVRLNKAQIRIVDLDDESCPHDHCPTLPGDIESDTSDSVGGKKQHPETEADDVDTVDKFERLLPIPLRRRRQMNYRRLFRKLRRSLAGDGAHHPPPSPPSPLSHPQSQSGLHLKPLATETDSLVILFYVSDAESDIASKELTKLCFECLSNDGGREVIASSRSFNGKIAEVAYKDLGAVEEESEQSSRQGMVVVIALASVAGACLAALAVLQMVIMRRRKGRGRSMRASLRRPPEDAQSVQSLSASIAALRRSLRRSFRGSDSTRSFAFVNVALQTEKEAMSNPMNFSKLASRSLEVDYLEEEFKMIPTNLPRMSQQQQGWANKNRFANIIPLEESRVKLQSEDTASDYINANYLSGYRGQQRSYIATQSPMRNTVADFWRMVWEQKSQVIVALSSCIEDGQPRCAEYLPDPSGLENVKVYGQLQVTAQKQIAAQDYLFCVVTLKHLESGLSRQTVHFHYTAWPAKGVPESPARMIKFIVDLRPYMEVNQGPVVVHCSTGTGRTGTLIAIDIGMHAYDDSRTIDVMNLVFRIRKERAGAVQTKEQYAFVYKALLEYAAECASACSGTASLASAHSSRLSLQECQNEL